MRSKVIVTCDYCGKEMQENGMKVIYRKPRTESLLGAATETILDMCDDCADRMEKEIKRLIWSELTRS